MKTRAIIFSFFLALSALCRAQIPVVTPTVAVTPTPTVSATATPGSSPNGTPNVYPGTPTPTISPAAPTPAELDTFYQPPTTDAQTGTKLEWRAFVPTDGAGKWPVVIILHIGGYHNGSYYDSLNTAPQDLADAGFYTVVASYPLAPKNLIKNQYPHDASPRGIASGRPPQQTRAVEALVSAAKGDTHCLNNLVAVLGGSAGAGHAAFIALDETDTFGVWPFWKDQARPKFVACLSGQYDFAERDMDVDSHFIDNTENYTNSTTPMEQWNASPIAQIKLLLPTFIPMYFIRSENDPGSAASQQYYMWNALTRAGASPSLFRMWTIPDSDNHAFGYWNDRTYDSYPLSTTNIDFKVKDRVIGFFKQYLK